MKNTLNLFAFLALLLVSFQFSSCSSDDDPEITAESLIGTWTQTSFVSTGCTDPNDNQDLSTCTTACETIVVTATTVSINGDAPMTYTTDGNTITTDGDTITWAISGTTLTITDVDSAADGGCTSVITYIRVS
jgi:hypothetical protein